MRLYLEVIDGPEIGQKFSLEKKTTFGRQGTDIALADSRLSSHHATFDYSDKDGWVLSDNKSRNGVWVNGTKEIRAILRNGDLIRLGGVEIYCRLGETQSYKFSEGIQRWAQGLVSQVKNSKSQLKEIKPPFTLKFIQGIQTGETVEVFYGPRAAGRGSLDVCLYDEQAPEDAFTIEVKGKYPYFFTPIPDSVRLNQQSVSRQQLAPGDKIFLGETVIEVEFEEGYGFSS